MKKSVNDLIPIDEYGIVKYVDGNNEIGRAKFWVKISNSKNIILFFWLTLNFFIELSFGSGFFISKAKLSSAELR